MTTTDALLLVNMGGPASLDEVEGYLQSIFLDPAILPLPELLRPWLARTIARRRAPTVGERYRSVGGVSPLLGWTERQAALVQRALPHRTVAHAYRYAHPTIEEALAELAQRGTRRVTLLPMFPHFSTAMTGSILREARRVAEREELALEAVEAWGTQPAVLAVLCRLLSGAVDRAGAGARVLFVAHGIPMRDVRRGDRYPEEVETTARVLGTSLRQGPPWSLAYQSRVGPLSWTAPYLEDELARLAQSSAPLVLMPLSFAADCLETMYDLDQVARASAVAAGIDTVVRVSAPNDDPAFIRALARLGERAMAVAA